MRISIDKKKRFQIIAIIISIGFVLAGIFGKRYFEVKVDYEQRLAAIKPDINKHNKESEIKEIIMSYTDEYTKYVSVWTSQEENSDRLSNLEAVIVYNTEVPDNIKESLITAISDKFSMDISTINLCYMDYSEIINNP